MSQGRIVIERFESQVLHGNPMDDAIRRDVVVYLPPDYDASEQRYPCVYVLSGFGGRGAMQLNDSAWDETLAQRMDRLIASGAVRPMILVMPDCLTRLGGSQYINSSATGRYGDYIVEDLVPFIDRSYRSVPERDFRAVMGKSSGGYGALILSMHHPDVFGLAASHSGDMYFELCYRPWFLDYVRGIQRFGDLTGFLRQFQTCRPRDSHYRSMLNTVAMASCYSPNPQVPPGFELPFDVHTGEIIDQIWARWLAWDPVHLVEHHAEALRSLRFLYLDAGTADEFNLQFGARIFCNRLKQHGIQFRHEEFNDGHMNIPYRYDISLAGISGAMPASPQR